MPRYLIEISGWVYAESEEDAVNLVENTLSANISDFELDNSSMLESDESEDD
jgi:hypothetical protein